MFRKKYNLYKETFENETTKNKLAEKREIS